MNRKISEKLRTRIIKNTLLGSVAYYIVIGVGMMAAFLDMSKYGYTPFLTILGGITALNALNLLLTKKRNIITKSFARGMLIAQLVTWLFFFTSLLFIVETMRPILLMSSIMAITFVFSYQRLKTSIMTSFVIAATYLLVCYIGIYHFEQSGRFSFDILLIGCYIPASIFIAYMADRMAKQRNQLKKTKRELQGAIKERQSVLNKLEQIALTDDLTQLMNRRAMTRQLAREFERVKRYKTDVAILLIDIDHFKQINDSMGHDCGDYVLKEFSQVLVNTVRDIDYVCRWGGEEFLILLSEISIKNANKVASRVLDNVMATAFSYQSNSFHVSFSGGLIYLDTEFSIKENLKIVDQRLYLAKQNGRKQIVAQSA